MNDKNWIVILISFIVGFVVAYISIYHIRQEDDTFLVHINDSYEFCNNDFYTKDYIDGIINDFDLKTYIKNISDYCDN